MAERPPLSSFEERPPLSSFEDTAGGQPSPTIGENALDVAKQIPAGLMAGLAGPNWLRRAGQAQLEAENLTNLPAPKAADYEQAAAKALPEPIGMPGRIARAATESIPMGIATGLPPNPASLALQAASAGAEQGVGEATGSPLLGAVAGIGTSLVPGAYQGLRSLLGKHMDYRGAPILNELNDSIDQRYGGVRALGIKFEPAAATDKLQDIRQLDTLDTALAPRSNDLLERYANNFENADHVSFDKVEALRRKLSKLSLDKDANEAEGARDAVRAIDNWWANPKDSVIAGDAQALAREAGLARAEAAAGFRMKAMDSLRERAENTARAGTVTAERAFRTELKNFIRPNDKGISRAMREGFNQREIAELGRASSIGSFPYLLRAIGVAGGFLGLGVGAGATAYTHDPQYLAYGALGMGARGLNGLLMRSRADRVQRMIASRSPLAAERGIRPSPVTPTPGRNYMIYPGVIGINAIRSAAGFKNGGRVAKSFRYKQS